MSVPWEPGQSKVERAKRNGDHLRGTIEQTLGEACTHFGKDDVQLLKFHGTYQQDDRDVRHERRKAGLEEAFTFMIRCAIPGGVLNAEQYLNLDAIADQYANGTLRATTRQGFQFHGVIKKNLKATIAGINEKMVTTLSACGDVARNVMACSAPLPDAAHVIVRGLAVQIARELRPAGNAYHEIWLDGEKTVAAPKEEPFYGDQYLPRKFKVGIALAEDNCIDVYTQDVGLIALVEGENLLGFNVVVGGGMGMTHNKADTSARLGRPLGFIAVEHAVETARTVAAIFRDFGNRRDRRHARLKYLIAERGLDWFREEFAGRTSFSLDNWRPIERPGFHDHLGRHEQDEGRFFYGIYIDNGRIKDEGEYRLKTALRTIVETHHPGITLTAHQNMLLTGLDDAAVQDIERTLIEHGVTPADRLSAARRYSMACPALPTCGLAMAESERTMPAVVDRFEALLDQLGLRDAPITLRMTGCPNGCARPYTADIAFVGRRPEIYHVYVGGGVSGDRLVDLYAADVPEAELIETLQPLLTDWAKQRQIGESFGDYYQRLLDRESPRRAITGREEPTRETIQLKVLS